MSRDIDKQQAYKLVYEDLIEMNLFKGIYDARHTEEDSIDLFMAGISMVMEFIAYRVSDTVYDEYLDLWNKNVSQSIAKAERSNTDE